MSLLHSIVPSDIVIFDVLGVDLIHSLDFLGDRHFNGILHLDIELGLFRGKLGLLFSKILVVLLSGIGNDILHFSLKICTQVDELGFPLSIAILMDAVLPLF